MHRIDILFDLILDNLRKQISRLENHILFLFIVLLLLRSHTSFCVFFLFTKVLRFDFISIIISFPEMNRMLDLEGVQQKSCPTDQRRS